MAMAYPTPASSEIEEINIQNDNQLSSAMVEASYASSSSTSAYPINSSSVGYGYDVFINHRGPDTKKTFASHLYSRLRSHGFRPFIDHHELEEGQSFPSQIEDAIRSASVHVAIFSPKYAESYWCLHELLLMQESKAPIIPVFYGVNPGDMRWTDQNKGVYAGDLEQLQMKKKYDCETAQKKPRYDPLTIQNWKKALSNVADTTGFDLHGKFNGEEGQMLDSLVERVVKIMDKHKRLYVARYPTGVDEKVKYFEAQVTRQKSKGKVQMVGIVGPGGVGKSTLAKEFFNRKRLEYNKYCFLSDVRETAKSSLLSLQNKLLKDSTHLDLHVGDIHEGTEMLRRFMLSQHVLLILDDIDHEDQVLALLPDRDVLREDSLILITSRDIDVLARSGVEKSSIFKSTGLSEERSRELFCLHAFCKPYPLREFEDLVDEFLRACKGLPLSLKVFGALLFGKNKSDWKDIFDQYRLPDDIQKSLRISYDALSEQEQYIFLDIACFFLGENKKSAITVWDSSGWRGSLLFRNLKRKCLVELGWEWDRMTPRKVIRMHDHIRDLGRDIAQKKMPPRLRCAPENIDDWLHHKSSLLSEARGITSSPMFSLYQSNGNLFGNRPMNLVNTLGRFLGIGCMMELRFPGVENCIIKLLYTLYRSIGISAMNLQLLSTEGHLLERILRRVNTPNLICLFWSKCPYSYLPSWIPMNNLRVLSVSGRELKTLWQGNSQAPLQLRVLKCDNLERLPDSFGNLVNLQHMDLYLCSKLKRLPDSFGNLINLQHMHLDDCRNLERLPDSFGNLVNLQHMRLVQCVNLERLPDSFGKLVKLQHVQLLSCRKWDKLPDSFGNLVKLQHVQLSDCCNLDKLPDSFGNLVKLQHVDLWGCYNLDKLPDSFCNLVNLQHLKLHGSGKLERLPYFFGNLVKLEHLSLSHCQKLERLPDSFGNLVNLQHMDLYGCVKLEMLSDSFGNLANLQYMNLSLCENLERLPAFCNLAAHQHIGNLTNLREISLSGCRKLERLPSSFGCLTSLKLFEASGCSNLTISSDTLGNIRTLERVDLSGCEKIEVWPSQLVLQRSLKTLKLTGTNFKELPCAIELPKGLVVLWIGSPLVDTLLPSLGDFRNLSELRLRDCRELTHLPASVGLLTQLTWLEVARCPAVELPFKMVKGQRGTLKCDSSMHNYMSPLRHLILQEDTEISEVSFDEDVCPNLQHFILGECSNLAKVGILPGTLIKVDMYRCLNLRNTDGLCGLAKLQSLTIGNCNELQELPSTETWISLEYLKIFNCVKLKTIRDLAQPPKLEIIVVHGCLQLEELEGVEYCISLVELNIDNCPKLQWLEGVVERLKKRLNLLLK